MVIGDVRNEECLLMTGLGSYLPANENFRLSAWIYIGICGTEKVNLAPGQKFTFAFPFT
jgi:hypothetical protein